MKKNTLLHDLIRNIIPFAVVAGDDIFGANYTLITERSHHHWHRCDLSHTSKKTGKIYSCMAMSGRDITELKYLVTEKEIRVHFQSHTITDESGSLSLPITVYHPVNSPALMGWEYYSQFEKAETL